MTRYIVTRSGRRISQRAGAPTLNDVAVSLCRTPMFGGATREYYSVGHHVLATSLLAEYYANPTVALFAALHESEVVAWGDTPGPMKTEVQRGLESSLRSRFYVELGLDWLDAQAAWERVELFDKVEQAACATWAGLAETVHEGIWLNQTVDFQDRAIEITKQVHRQYPPRDQLAVDAPLAAAIVARVRELIVRAGCRVVRDPV